MKGSIFILLLTAVLGFPFIGSANDAPDKAAKTITASPSAEETTTSDDKKTEKEAEIKDKIKEGLYAPDFCDFSVTFPEKPFSSRKCPQGQSRNSGQCFDKVTYTMVYDLATTVDITVSCIPSTPDKYDRYSERVIKTALRGMINRTNISDPTINVRTLEEQQVRQGSVIGAGVGGRQSKIYNAQLWVGQNSVFTIEAQLIGPSHHEADAVFGDILGSIQKK